MTNTAKTLKRLAVSALFSAMICVVTAYIFHVPICMNGRYIHFGDVFVFLAAAILPKGYALSAALVGSCLADLLTAPMWTIPTLFIKLLIVLPFSAKSEKLLTKRNLLAALLSAPISCALYYLAESLMFGNWIAPALDIPLGLIQYLGCPAAFILAALALDRAHIKKRIGEDYV